MKAYWFAMILLALHQTAAVADIIFSVSPLMQSIPQGSTAIFDIFVESNSGPITVTGLETGVAAGNGLTDGEILATSPITILNTGFFFPNFPQRGIAFGAVNQVGGTIIDGQQPFGQIYLNTTGVSFGTYSLVLDSELALNINNLPINIAAPGASAQYTIVAAIPEPTSSGLIGIGALLAFLTRPRRRANAHVSYVARSESTRIARYSKTTANSL